MTEPLTQEDRTRLRELAEKATTGPWAWRGYMNGSIELRTMHSGQLRIVSTARSQPCVVELADSSLSLTAQACDSCKQAYAAWVKGKYPEDYRCPLPENLDTIWFNTPGECFIQPANTWAVRDVSYRDDTSKVDHPDASYIAAMSPDKVLALLSQLDDLEAALDSTRSGEVT